MGGLSETDIGRFADLLDTARFARVCIHPFARRLGLDEADAYRVQKAGLMLRWNRGEVPVGFKLGFTSEAMRKQMGVLSANFGILTSAMLVDAGKGLNTTMLTHPRAEPEVALRLVRGLGYPVERRQAESAIGACAVAIEIVDSRFHNYQFALEDNIADNSSAAACVLGTWQEVPSNFDRLKVRFSIDGEVVEEGSSGAAMGGPVDALLEAARLANTWGHMLAANDIILTGGLTAAPHIRSGQTVGAHIGGLEEIVVAVR
jgi:2-oxo-3-hexenedioate decarboxylase